jgi:hypothetical protein
MAICNVCHKGIVQFVGYDIEKKAGGALGKPYYVYQCTFPGCLAEMRMPVPSDWWIEHPQVMRQTGGYIKGHKVIL